jgi:hypothetical protein
VIVEDQGSSRIYYYLHKYSVLDCLSHKNILSSSRLCFHSSGLLKLSTVRFRFPPLGESFRDKAILVQVSEWSSDTVALPEALDLLGFCLEGARPHVSERWSAS